ncbi:MAG: hypothetical protein ACKO1I_07095, partial [Microcystis aeruginosa]
MWYIAWYKKQGQQSLKRPAPDSETPDSYPQEKLFQQTLLTLSSLLLLFCVSLGLGFAGAANTFVENEELRVKRSQRLPQLF